MANASVTIYVTQASYILSNLPAELTFHDVIAVDNLRYTAKLIFAKFAGLCVFFDPGFFQNLRRGMSTNTNNVGQ
jgi:hypothetical protein